MNYHLKNISMLAGICLPFSHDLPAGRIPGMQRFHSFLCGATLLKARARSM